MLSADQDALTADDQDEIRASGRDPADVAAQVAILRGGRKPVPILRPATLADGIHPIDEADRAVLYRLHGEAAAAGRVSAFVPASGSGTRLFQSLLLLYREETTDRDALRARATAGDATAADALAILDNITDLAIWRDLERRGCPADSVAQILETLFGEEGLAHHELPKGLIPFHQYDDRVRTAFAEHLHEAVALTKDADNRCRIHFTVSAAHLDRFRAEWQRERPSLEGRLGVAFEVDFSIQSGATDTIAIDLDGNVRRDEEGRILFWPGGHGALLENLGRSGADIVVIKNIDNTSREELSGTITGIRRQICGWLVLVESRVHEAIRALRQGGPPQPALDLLARLFGVAPPPALSGEHDRRAYAVDQLNRPLRVCGMVSSLTHTGGRPFWVDVEGRGQALQIVEGAEIDMTSARERDMFVHAHHFNPVDMACSLRDVDGRPFDLAAYRTAGRAIIAEKVLDGVRSRIYERPGLWNGGMSLWNTIFVEIPDVTFNPVKSLADLLHPSHKGA